MKKNKTNKALATLAIAGMAITMVPFNAFADGVTTARLFGADRVGTAVAVADAGWTTAATAILAPSADANLVDALAAAPLAGKAAPVLLTDNNTLTAATQAELVKLGVKNVYVVGAISQTVVDQVNAMTGVTATVLKGADRIGTAAAISAKLTAPAGSFVVGYGALADALSVASYAAANNYSILVANPDGTLPASEAAYKGATTYIVGGPTLVADIPGATRLFGADRFATNQAVLNALTYKYDKAYVANGTDAHLVDSLVASSLAGMSNAPIVLGDTTSAAAAGSVHAKLAANAVVTALGGTAVVPDSVVGQVVNGATVVPVGSPVSIGDLMVTGQTVGTGALSSPAVGTINTGITVAATVSGASAANASITYLVTTSNNITAKDTAGNTLVATTLNSPIIIGNDTFNASYTVPTDASGTVKAVFTSTASSQQTFNVVAEAPFSNNGQPVQSDEVSIEWGVPGSLVLSPIYSAGSPDSLNFSTSSATTKGLVPVVATLLPAATSTTDTTATTTAVSGQSVKFTMTTALPNTSTAFYTNSTGTTMVAQGAYVGSGVSSANYVATTDANGQALIYINANQPTTNSVANTSSNIKIGLQAQLVNGGGSTNTGYYQWKSISQPAKIANVSPAAMLNVTGVTQTNTVVATNAETATSGSQLTISGTVQDSAGNPVPNASIAIQDYNVADTNAYSNNVQNDAYVLNGTTTLFSAVNYPIVTTDSSGNYSVNVTANVPVTQSVYNSVTRYYAFYVPPTIAVSSGQSLPSTVTKLDYVGNGNPDGSINLVWQQGQTAQSVGVSHTSLSAQYSTLSDVPQTYPFSNVVGSDQLIYAAAFNQNGTIVAPASGNQFDGYDLEYDLTAPSGIEFETLGSAYLPSGVTEIKAHYNQYDNGTNPKLIVDHMYVNGTEIALPTTDAKTGNAIDYSSAYDGSGQLNFYLNSNPSSVTTTSGTAGSVNVNIAVYSNTSAAGVIDANHAQGSASGTVNATFGASNTITSIGVAGDMSGFNAYGPLLEGNAAPDSTTSVAGTASDDWTSSNASLVVAPFNSYPAISTVPSQGLTMNLSSDKTGLFRYVDGYQLATKPSNVSVNVNSLGEVSVNNYKLWTATGGYRVVGYATNVAADGSTSGTSNITLVEQSIAAPTTFIVHTVGGAATTVTIPSAYLPGNFEGYLGFKTDATTGALQPLVASYYANSKTNQFAPGSGTTSFLGMTFAPVVAATVQVSDKYSETPTVTVTNSVNSQTAKATVAFTSQNTGVVAIKKNPTSANGVAGVGQNMTLTALDTYGNAVPNQTLYLSTNLTGLWITAVNGTTITSSVNMGNTGSTSMQNENTPVPLFVYSAENPDLAKPAYDTVSVSGIMAYHLSSAPVVQLQTGTDGTVSITLQDGAVAYPILVGDQAGSRDIGVDPGRKIPSGTTMTVTNSSGTVIGNIPITWAGITESN